MNEDDLARLRHMLDAAREAIAFSEGKSFDNVIEERMLLLALVKDLEIVGEAASRVSIETRTSIEEIP